MLMAEVHAIEEVRFGAFTGAERIRQLHVGRYRATIERDRERYEVRERMMGRERERERERERSDERE